MKATCLPPSARGPIEVQATEGRAGLLRIDLEILLWGSMIEVIKMGAEAGEEIEGAGQQEESTGATRRRDTVDLQLRLLPKDGALRP